MFNFSANPEIPCIYNVNNFPLNLCSSGDSIFLQIQTFRIYIMYTIISRWIFSVLDIQFYCKSCQFEHILYKISSWILKGLDNQFNCKSKHFVHITCTIFLWIYAVLDIQFFCNSRHSEHILYTISCWVLGVLDIQFYCKSS